MADEGFLRRWARRKSEVREGRAPEPAPVAEATPEVAGFAAPVANIAEPQPLPTERPLPTMDDVAALDTDSDFSSFVAHGVDQAVRRSALKKLFADPHFGIMDRLDVYIDDYTQASPVSEAMLASLNHAKSAFTKMVEDDPETPEAEAALQTQEPQQPQQPQHPPEQETQ